MSFRLNECRDDEVEEDNNINFSFEQQIPIGNKDQNFNSSFQEFNHRNSLNSNIHHKVSLEDDEHKNKENIFEISFENGKFGNKIQNIIPRSPINQNPFKNENNNISFDNMYFGNYNELENKNKSQNQSFEDETKQLKLKNQTSNYKYSFSTSNESVLTHTNSNSLKKSFSQIMINSELRNLCNVVGGKIMITKLNVFNKLIIEKKDNKIFSLKSQIILDQFSKEIEKTDFILKSKTREAKLYSFTKISLFTKNINKNKKHQKCNFGFSLEKSKTNDADYFRNVLIEVLNVNKNHLSYEKYYDTIKNIIGPTLDESSLYFPDKCEIRKPQKLFFLNKNLSYDFDSYSSNSINTTSFKFSKKISEIFQKDNLNL